ncbi:AAA family ATPase [Xenorhabdus hominickii]|uniref:ATP-binding protein n=1 Tax=Xenorhabdus hominickii TaxID=351679 RepID=A0A2G0Q1L0_XENHO|nr:AAA family ATPase [Xenorhabdus hominickii]AOM40376.1 ATP-binding protein [Xenorhabdus hominickii]PHM53109.1 ATP-binding protein [Xenorhabdus hominickii]
MISAFFINNYRSIRDLRIVLGALNVITGPNGSGKSNLYRALRLLSETAQGGVVNSLALEGGLDSAFWAGPETFSNAVRTGTLPVQGRVRREVKRLRLGFTTDSLSYSIALGLPEPSMSAFTLDPEIKQECIWGGGSYHPAGLMVERKGAIIRVRKGRKWQIASEHINSFTSMFDQLADPSTAPEVFHLREFIRGWRFYDHFRTDSDAPARKAQIGTRTPVLHHDGRDLAAALQTIREIGDAQLLDESIDDAFPGASLHIARSDEGQFTIQFQQHGLIRPLSGAELSDGTLRYLLWIAALLTPRPPSMMVLNEPETSLHPELLPSLARLIIQASRHTQLWVVSHSPVLISSLGQSSLCQPIQLTKQLGETYISGIDILDEPAWRWPDKN